MNGNDSTNRVGLPTETTKRVLVIDDSPFILEATGAALTDAGFDVRVASSLGEVEEERRTDNDLILVDVEMPGALGVDVATLLRGTRGERAPIFFLSALPDDELARRVADAKIEGFISKRGGIPSVVRRVQEILGVAPSIDDLQGGAGPA
jgi:DNA-binding response OmpR family regulator